MGRQVRILTWENLDCAHACADGSGMETHVFIRLTIHPTHNKPHVSEKQKI